MKPLKIAFDFDNTIANSNLAMIELYKVYHPNVIHTNYPKYEFVSEWNYQDIIPEITGEEVESYFNNPKLFELITPFMDRYLTMIDLIEELIAEGHNVFVASKGSSQNLELKKLWLKQHIPSFDLDNLIGIPLNVTGKPDEYLRGIDILIDDVDANFNNSVKHKILFVNQGEKSWNQVGLMDSKLTVVDSVSQLANTIYDIINFERVR